MICKPEGRKRVITKEEKGGSIPSTLTLLTPEVAKLEQGEKKELLKRVQECTNSKREQRNWGTVTLNGSEYVWKIDYYNVNGQFLSQDGNNPRQTRQVITIMEAQEYSI